MNVLSLIEVFPVYFPKCVIVVVPDEEMEEGTPTTIEENLLDETGKYTIRIKESVYERACNGSGGDRMHIIHEMSHYILIEEYGFKPLTARSYGNIVVRYKPCSMEWQAKALAIQRTQHPNIWIQLLMAIILSISITTNKCHT